MGKLACITQQLRLETSINCFPKFISGEATVTNAEHKRHKDRGYRQIQSHLLHPESLERFKSYST